jgi:hypothetical protein
MNAVELLEIGDSLGFILPDEMLRRLKVGLGDTLFLTQTARGFNLTTVDPQSMQGGAAELSPIQVLSQPLNQNKK